MLSLSRSSSKASVSVSRFLQQDDAVKDICFVFDELIGGPNEDFPNIVLCQMQSLAVALELVVASVDGPAVLIGRVPDLCPVPAAALAAFDFPREAGRVQGLIGKRPSFFRRAISCCT